MRYALAVLMLLAPGQAGAETQVLTKGYSCERGVRIPAVYVNSADESVAVINVEGRQIVLTRTEAASGVRYAWPADGSGYVWWTKGDEATLAWFDAEHSEEVTLYNNCAAD
ncbi:MAG: MliC family protein [Paracoccaceae bacterium]